MKAPSFFIETEEKDKMMLQYRYNMVKCNLLKTGFWSSHPKSRTRRRGFHYYVQGQVSPTLCIGVKFPFHLNK